MGDVLIKRSGIGQFDKGVFANRDFKRGEVVGKYSDLKKLTEEEYKNSWKRKQFTHSHWGAVYLYPSPARYVNRSSKPEREM